MPGLCKSQSVSIPLISKTNIINPPSKVDIKEAIERDDVFFFVKELDFMKPENFSALKFDEFETSLHHLAAKYCSLKVAQTLVDHCKLKDVNVENLKGMRPIHYLVMFTNFNAIDEESKSRVQSSPKYLIFRDYLEFLIENKASLNAVDRRDYTALNYAALKNNWMAAELLIQHQTIRSQNNGEKIDKLNLNLIRSLEISCEYNSFEVANLLVDKMEAKSLKDCRKNIYHSIVQSRGDHMGKIKLLFKAVMSKLFDPGREHLTARDPQTKMNILDMAIVNQHLGVIQILAENPNEFECLKHPAGRDVDWPIHWVAKSGSIECFELLASDDVGKLDSKSNNILHLSIAHQQIEFIEYLIGRRELPTLTMVKNSDNLTPFEYGIYLGYLGSARLIEKHTNLNQLEFKFGKKSLFQACVEDSGFESVKYLFEILNKRFNLTNEREQFLRQTFYMVTEPDENTMFHLAALRNDSFHMIKYLLEKCDFAIDDLLFFKNRDELTCLHLCCIRGDEDSVRYLLGKMPNNRLKFMLLNSRDSESNSPLHLACKLNHEKVVRTLIEFGAELTVRNINGQNPFHICCENSNIGILGILFDNSPESSVDWQMMDSAIKKDDGRLFEYLVGQDISYLEANQLRSGRERIFDEAFKIKSLSILETLIRDPDWMSYLGIDLNESNNLLDYSRFKSLAKYNPNLACLILDKFVSSEKSMILYDFRFLDPTPKSVANDLDNHPMFILSKTENSQILSHKVVKKLAKLKWNGEQTFLNSTPIIFFTLHFILFLIYLISMTVLIILVNNFVNDLKKNVAQNFSNSSIIAHPFTDASNWTNSTANLTLKVENILFRSYSHEYYGYIERQPWFTPVFIVSYTLSGVSLLKIIVVQIFKMKYSMENVYTLEYVLETITYLISHVYALNLVVTQFELLFDLGPFLLILNWSVLILFIEKFLVFGIFALMLKKILIQSVKILPILVIMLMGFSFGLSIIRRERIEWDSLFTTFLKTMEAMIDLSSEEEYKQTYLAGIVFFLFMCMICLVLLNLFIGIAIGEIESVYEEADVKQLSVQLKFCLRVQFFLFPNNSSMVFRLHQEERAVKPKKTYKFGHKHFNYKLERENQEKQENAIKDLTDKVDFICKQLEIRN